MPHSERTPQEWFEDAMRHYAEHHQGCCWCGGANRVYRSERGGRLEFECGDCEFYACREADSVRYFMAPGHGRHAASPPTLHAV